LLLAIALRSRPLIPSAMQNTRLSILVDNLSERLVGWLRNPWRRISIAIISILLGNFLASVVSTTAGQQGRIDALLAAVMVVMTEVAIWLVYVQPQQLGLTRDRKPPLVWWKEMINGLRIGFIYGMYLLALTLGS
jgi:hypothetical protein